MEKISKIFKALDKNYVGKLFEEKRLIYFPDLGNTPIQKVEIKRISPLWAKETCVVRYKIYSGQDTVKIIRGTAGQKQLKKNAWQLMKYLESQGFNQRIFRIPRPLDFLEHDGLLLYEEAPGTPLSLIIEKRKISEIKKGLKKTAQWLVKLHQQRPKKDVFPNALFRKSDDYINIFKKIKQLMPELKNYLIDSSEIRLIKKLEENQKTLIHNDFYPGNIILNQEIIYVIDFEKAGFGSPLSDIATFYGWFEFPEKVWQLNFSKKEIQSLQSTFLREYCRLQNLDYSRFRRQLNKFLVKIFLDQVYEFAVIALKGWGFFDLAAKKHYQEIISGLLKKVKHYQSLT